jgi:hypothetical protein
MITVGDRFEITMEVVGVAGDWRHLLVKPDGARQDDFLCKITESALLAGRRLPRAIKVGDRVKWGQAVATVEFIAAPDHLENVQALVRDASRELFIFPIADLTLIPGDEKD